MQTQVQRGGGVGINGVLNTGSGLIYAETGMLSNILSDNYRIFYESITRYLVQGYYALALSFDINHTTTFGFGNSMFLARNANSIFETTYFTQQSLPGLLEAKHEWGMFTLWHSIYTWFASDFGHIGALILISIFSYLLSISWGLSLCTLQHKWIIMFSLLLILFYYIPANNQIFQSGESCIGFFLILIGLKLRFRSKQAAITKP